MLSPLPASIPFTLHVPLCLSQEMPDLALPDTRPSPSDPLPQDCFTSNFQPCLASLLPCILSTGSFLLPRVSPHHLIRHQVAKRPVKSTGDALLPALTARSPPESPAHPTPRTLGQAPAPRPLPRHPDALLLLLLPLGVSCTLREKQGGGGLCSPCAASKGRGWCGSASGRGASGSSAARAGSAPAPRLGGPPPAVQ